MLEEERQRDRWAHVKERIMELWQNITEDELDRTRGNISSISHLILKRHDESKQNIAARLVDVLHETTIEDEQL